MPASSWNLREIAPPSSSASASLDGRRPPPPIRDSLPRLVGDMDVLCVFHLSLVAGGETDLFL